MKELRNRHLSNRIGQQNRRHSTSVGCRLFLCVLGLKITYFLLCDALFKDGHIWLHLFVWFGLKAWKLLLFSKSTTRIKEAQSGERFSFCGKVFFENHNNHVLVAKTSENILSYVLFEHFSWTNCNLFLKPLDKKTWNYYNV